MNLNHLNDIEGLKFMPVRANKLPIIKGWQQSNDKHDLSNCEAVGIVCGELSGNLEVIDVDVKYDLTGKLFDNYKKLVHEIDNELLKKLVIQKTKNGGYHIIYRCSKIEGNQKFANRSTTKEEKNDTFQESYKSELKRSGDEMTAKNIAEKAAKNDKIRVLLESRGEGGFIMCFPTDGYELIYGDYYSITEITPEERDVLHGIARQFNQIVEEAPVYKLPKTKQKGLSPLDDYNERGDVCGLLASHGWKVVGNKGNKTIFLRPGQTTSQSSGNYDHDKKWFSVFTTSTEFEPMKAYLPYSVYAKLECNDDYSEATRRLSELGFGDAKEEKKEEHKSTRKIYSRVNTDDNDLSPFAKPEDYDYYLQQVIDGTLPMGLTTGIPMLDESFLFKQGNLVMNNGIDNTGKSVFSWYLSLLSAMYHDWNWVIFSSENTLGAFMRKMIQFYWGKQLHGEYAMNEKEFKIAKEFVEKHFLLIKAEEELYNYKDIINLAKKALKIKKYNAAMIDPYNSLKIDLSGFSKLNTHEYHYEAISEIKAHGQKNNFGWWINLHAVTNAARAKDSDRKYPLAPRKEDTEGGQKFPNKADDFITTHRLTQHPTDWRITEIHVRKIKDTETGGRPTPLDEPVKLEMYKGMTAFKEYSELQPRIDPIEEWHKKQGTFKQAQIFKQTFQQTWTPYKDEEVGF